jgi:hypothetical protein
MITAFAFNGGPAQEDVFVHDDGPDEDDGSEYGYGYNGVSLDGYFSN